ncbi:MAG: ABC transporter permease [Clostridia bacterium]|nr:ABC transporter permease [Clostridia bacterium]
MDKNIAFEQNAFDRLPPDSFEREKIARPPTTYAQDVWRSFKKRKTAVLGGVVLILLLIMVLIGPYLSKYDYITNDYTAINKAPYGDHWFGTDTLGRDMWVRVWQGGRISLFIAVVATIIPWAFGMILGGLCGYIGGKLDMIVMRCVDVLLGIPSMILNILLMVVMGAGNIGTLIIAFSVTGWLGACRGTRGLVLQLKAREFVMASQTLGASSSRIILKHLLPNTLGVTVVSISGAIPGAIFHEAFLSYIGLGVGPPNPSWGSLIKTASEVFKEYPYQFAFPCICVALTMLSCNLLGDGLRDALDPRLRS